MTLEETKDLATIIGAVVALSALIKGVIEYAHQGALKRAEGFAAMRVRFKDDASFKNICDLLETDDPALLKISFKDKRDFLGFFEEIAIMMNSRLIKPAVAHYMFGYYALRCADSEHFWHSVNPNSPYWSVFINFAERMSRVEKRFNSANRRLRF